MQTRRRSLYESLGGGALGIAYAIPLNVLLLTTMPFTDPWLMSIWITFWFTLASIVFKFVMRRAFEWLDRHYPTQ